MRLVELAFSSGDSSVSRPILIVFRSSSPAAAVFFRLKSAGKDGSRLGWGRTRIRRRAVHTEWSGERPAQIQRKVQASWAGYWIINIKLSCPRFQIILLFLAPSNELNFN